jgi:signal transduction histidine kinase
VTELVINALKYAFPVFRDDALILVTYECDADDWKLVVSDNGVGKDDDAARKVESGLGTTIVGALAKQLEARMETTSGASGFKTAITRATFISRMPQANRPERKAAYGYPRSDADRHESGQQRERFVALPVLARTSTNGPNPP